MSIVLREVELPEIGLPAEPRPELAAAVYAERLARVRARMAAHGLDALVIYGDREHFANVHWLTRYDPRFEETLLVVRPDGTPTLFVGNEGMGYSGIARLAVERVLYQPFSLLGQPRDRVAPLAGLLREAGLAGCRRVGAVGWKYFDAAEFAAPETVLDLPEFIAGAVRAALPATARLTNETAIFMAATTGLRNILEVEQMADFEWIATANSQALLDAIGGLRPGMTEHEAFGNTHCNGLPLACHPVCSSGEHCRAYGMASATCRRLAVGDPMMLTMSYRGANCCRFGWLAHGREELPPAVCGYVEAVAAPYAAALFGWHEAMRIGATGDALHRAVLDQLPSPPFHLGLNVGHLIAADEWTHSSVYAGSAEAVVDGMYWQADFFPTLTTAHHGAFAEDGLMIAGAERRVELARRFPAMWQRIDTRRRFMTDQLGIRLAPEVLPVANFPATVMPFLLAPQKVLVCAGEAVQ